MWFKRMELEIWFDRYQYAIDYDIGESAIKALNDFITKEDKHG